MKLFLQFSILRPRPISTLDPSALWLIMESRADTGCNIEKKDVLFSIILFLFVFFLKVFILIRFKIKRATSFGLLNNCYKETSDERLFLFRPISIANSCCAHTSIGLFFYSLNLQVFKRKRFKRLLLLLGKIYHWT